MTVERIRHPQKLGDRFGEPDRCTLSVVVGFDGWPGDLLRLHASLRAHEPAGSWELVVVDNPGDDTASATIAGLDHVRHAPLRDRLGWAASRNLGLRLASGSVVAVVDTSVETTGPLGSALAAGLSDPAVGLVGRWGVSTADGFEFAESAGPDVHAVEGYVLAVRRADLRATGLFDAKFAFYRNADIDFSFRIRDAGMRTVVDTSLPVVRHAHRTWETTPPDERDELSRRNFARFRRRWGERADLFTGTSQ